MRGIFPALCVLLFALISWQVAARGPLRALDEDLGRTVAASSAPGGAAQFLADLGNASVALPVLIAAMAVSVVLRRRQGLTRLWLPPVWAALTMAAVPAVTVPVKASIGRTGPPAMAASGMHDGFFPSGHTATAAVAYGAALLLLMQPLAATSRARPHASASPPPHAACARSAPHAGSALGSTPPHARSSRLKSGNRHARTRAWAAVAYVVLNVGVAAGLVRCGYHWPLDVVGAWCLSGVLLWGLAQVLTRPVPGRGSRPPRASTAPAAQDQ
ncbi:phosphatase PAP2 family protein [Streptomyces nondiastaticus]|uniref:phosphatase PAP2 family protein n=1 Tax=Streptomyces nondiastaticus TaxID=3154512 RepID=UPI0034210C3C